MGRKDTSNAFDIGHGPEDFERTNRIEAIRRLAHTLTGELESLSNTFDEMVVNKIHFYDEVRRFEIQLIKRALLIAGGSQVKAAHILQIKPTTLNSLIKRYDICWEEYRNFMHEWVEMDQASQARSQL